MKTLEEFWALLDRFAIEISEGRYGKKEERELTEVYKDALSEIENLQFELDCIEDME